MPNYRYTAPYPKFYPDIRDVNGKSLEAVEGTVVAWDSPPPPIDWAETGEPVTWVGQDMRPLTVPGPVEPAGESFPADPEPETPVAVPESPQEPAGAPEPVPSPDQA